MSDETFDLQERKNTVLDLIKECPQSHNLINFSCPIRNVRKLTTENLSHYIESLSEDQIENILSFHKECMSIDLSDCHTPQDDMDTFFKRGLNGYSPDSLKKSHSELEISKFNEKRRAERFPVPEGTTCIISVVNKSPDMISVKDISLAGMLLCDCEQRSEYPKNSILNGAYISIPADKLNNESSSFLFIDKAKIVRSFVDDTSQTVCYGIEFLNLDSYGRQQINSLLNTPYH